LVLAGDPQGRERYAASLDARAAALGIADRVRRVGHVADIPAALMQAAAVAVPSIEPEAFGRVAIEAQAMGVPVVATDLGAAADTVRTTPIEARTGWLVPPGDAAALAAGLDAALSLSPAEHAALAVRARQQAERFSLERMKTATLDAYRHLFAR
jgi:glycosyltransferase involved in cell wall biosynthesis